MTTSPFLDADRLREHRTRNTVHTALLTAGIGGLTLVSTALMWSWAAVPFALVSIGIIALIGPRIRPETVMRLYRAQPVGEPHGRQLVRIVTVLADRAELPRPPRLYVVPSLALNAFAAGRTGHAAIAITEGLLRRLSLREIAAVLAHEMSHIRNNDLMVMGLADAMTRFTQMLAYLALGLAILNIPAMLLGLDTFSWLAIALLYLAPALSSLMQLALSRAREFDADREAAGLTGDPEGLASALRQLEQHEGRLWEDLVLPPTRRIPAPSVLRSHPETAERIERLRDLVRHPLARPIEVAEEPLFSLVGVGPAEMAPRRRWPGLWY